MAKRKSTGNVFDDVTIRRGMSPEESPFPLPELAIGNIVRLKRPWPHYIKGKKRYPYGIISEHVSRNFVGIPKVGLHLFDGRGQMMMCPQQRTVPECADFVASELIVWHLVGTIYYEILNHGKGWTLYPTCPKCKNRNQHPFADKHCDACGGWGHVRELRKIPRSELAKLTWG